MRQLALLAMTCTGLAGCASGSARDQVRDVLYGYIDARAARDTERACSYLIRATPSCAPTGGEVSVFDGPIQLDEFRSSGDEASVTVSNRDRAGIVRLLHDDGRWRIAASELAREPFAVEDQQMLPGYDVGRTVSLDITARDAQGVQVGDVVAYRIPADEGCAQIGDDAMCAEAASHLTDQQSLARVVAVGGDDLTLRGGLLTRNGMLEAPDGLLPCADEGQKQCDFPEQITVEAGTVFLLGDNRPEATDSRYFGPVPEDAILGRVTE